MMEQHAAAFRQEAYELLSELEMALLTLEEDPGDQETIGRVFRALHTIKGSGAMFGFDDIAGFTHEVETVFDLVRNGKAPVTKELIDLTLAAGDQIRAMLDAGDDAGRIDRTAIDQILSRLRVLIPQQDETLRMDAEGPPAPTDESPENRTTYRIQIRLHPDVFSRGTDPMLLLNELRELGECRVIAHTERIPDLGGIDPEKCYTDWDVILTSGCGTDAIKDVFIFVEDECELKIEPIHEEDALDASAPYKRLGEILVDRGFISEEDFQSALRQQKRIGEILVESGLVDADKVNSALAEQQHVRHVRTKLREACSGSQSGEDLTSSIRVPAGRLDTLVNLVGELVTVQARLTQTAASLGNPEILSISEEVERLTAELRDSTMSIRMLPIGTTFSKFKRLVRDLSNELGKEVVLVTEGAETELDKTVIERLNDPLVHLIRNCIDHGIELPDARVAAGKPEHGTVHLSAAHSGANVLIRITDDGAGLDTSAIREKAVQNGLIAADSELSEKEVHGLIFAAGFSTARQITNISGRGVGMDVVKRSIETLRGSIDVSSRMGAGTTITLKLPLTLAIIDGLLVKVGDGDFVLPLSCVEECVELTREDVRRGHGRHMTPVRGALIPYIRLRERFSIDGDAPDIEQIVITESESGKVGFVVDKVIGEHQTVIKNLGRMYHDVDVVSGATILGDGTVALILDVPKLVGDAELDEASLN